MTHAKDADRDSHETKRHHATKTNPTPPYTGLRLVFAGSAARAQQKVPNILVIWGDDIGNQNISHNSRSMMGYQTPNIDRIAREGVGFTVKTC
jgi:hypothetical protein